MICFLAVYLKIIIFAPTNMEKGRMILLRIAGRTTQGKAYFGKALSNLLSVKVMPKEGHYCAEVRAHLRPGKSIFVPPRNDNDVQVRHYL